MSKRFQKSETLLKRSEAIIPLGAQTFSKSRTQFPVGASPFFLHSGEGARVTDVDGNDFIDFSSALGAIILGYADPDVNQAAAEQLKRGSVFSLSNELEVQLAEKLIQLIPSAEMVRFGKNGSDVTTGAIRLARAATGRDHVAICGYHGWHDWYIATTTKNAGVPQSVAGLSHSFRYNDLDSLKKLLDSKEVAAVIMEVTTFTPPAEGFLEGVRELCDRSGSVLIFDEIITGFRMDLGGAQKVYGVKPDLSTFAKGMANGFPLSALVGRADLMRQIEDIFFSFTFGGECVSLAASLATIEKLENTKALDQIHATGSQLLLDLHDLVERTGSGEFAAVEGHPSFPSLYFKEVSGCSSKKLETLFLQEILRNGILSLGTHMLTTSHGQPEIKKCLAVYEETLTTMRKGIQDRNVDQQLQCPPLQNLFSIR